MNIKPNEYCLAWDFQTDGCVIGLYLGDLVNPFAPFMPTRFRVARLTGEAFDAMGIAPLPPQIRVLDDYRHKRFSQSQPSNGAA